jgi:hypothetical protein
MINRIVEGIFRRSATASRLGWNSVDVGLITGSGRTGTQFLAWMLRRVGVHSLHEPHPDLFDVSIAKHRYNQNVVGELWSKRTPSVKTLKADQYIESNPNLTTLIEEANQVFNGVKVAFIVRNFYDYIESALNKSPDGSGEIFFYGENDHRNRLTAADFGEMSLLEWKELHRAEKIAWWWNKCSSIARKECKEGRIDARIFKFEDIFYKGEIRDLFTFLNVEWNDRYRRYLSTKKNQTSNKKLEYSQLNSEIKKRVDAMTKDNMRKVGYE